MVEGFFPLAPDPIPSRAARIILRAVPDYEGRLPADPDALASSPDAPRPYRCGFLAIVGMPNMGKSTLLNSLLSLRLCSTSKLPQTTRHSILGAVTSEEHRTQLLFTDTPGIIGDPAYALQEGMVGSIRSSLKGADVVLFVTDVYGEDLPDDDWLRRLEVYGDKVVVVINKADLLDADGLPPSPSPRDDDGRPQPLPLPSLVTKWRAALPRCRAVLPLCAIGTDDGGAAHPGLRALSSLLYAAESLPEDLRALGRPLPGTFAGDAPLPGADEVADLVPEGPALYPVDTVTDRSERFVASEMVREGIFGCLGAEVPYCCEVRVESFKTKKDAKAPGGRRIDVGATILVERESQVAIVVGKKGNMVKKVGTAARERMEEFFECKIYLDLRVKVEKGWRKNEDRLKDFGYM